MCGSVVRDAQGLPYSGSSGTIFLYGLILATMGATISWAAPACNNPVFAEVFVEPLFRIEHAQLRAIPRSESSQVFV